LRILVFYRWNKKRQAKQYRTWWSARM